MSVWFHLGVRVCTGCHCCSTDVLQTKWKAESIMFQCHCLPWCWTELQKYVSKSLTNFLVLRQESRKPFICKSQKQNDILFDLIHYMNVHCGFFWLLGRCLISAVKSKCSSLHSYCVLSSCLWNHFLHAFYNMHLIFPSVFTVYHKIWFAFKTKF